jgi:tetratricopeptide (TPR) repeat protein
MKRWFIPVLGMGVLTLLTFYITAAKSTSVRPTKHVMIPSPQTTPVDDAPKLPGATRELIALSSAPGPKMAGARIPESSSRPSAAVPGITFDQILETLVSSQAGFEQKQAAWKQLRSGGKIDQAIIELEQRLAGRVSKSPEMVAALGQAYWQKCASIEDIREQAILIMKADQMFDKALNLEPANWEARYTKALAMSYWPSEMNKGSEVIVQFRSLIEQQEAQLAQPEFERSYVRLGEAYEKAGLRDYALQVWQRGSAWFPESQELKKKLDSKRQSRE